MGIKNYIIWRLFVLIPVIFFSCTQTAKYPEEIVEQKLTAQYDKARWFLYYRLCSAKCQTGWGGKPQSRHLISDSKHLGSYELIFDTAYVNNDSLEFHFYFKISDSLNCIAGRGYVFNPRIGFIKDSIKYISYGNERWTYHDINLETARDKELENFIREHQNELDPWFYEQAKKRGLLTNAIGKTDDR